MRKIQDYSLFPNWKSTEAHLSCNKSTTFLGGSNWRHSVAENFMTSLEDWFVIEQVYDSRTCARIPEISVRNIKHGWVQLTSYRTLHLSRWSNILAYLYDTDSQCGPKFDLFNQRLFKFKQLPSSSQTGYPRNGFEWTGFCNHLKNGSKAHCNVDSRIGCGDIFRDGFADCLRKSSCARQIW